MIMNIAMSQNQTQSAELVDLLVLGSGEAGKYLAWTLGSAGKRVALIERRWIGGSCPNIACLPSKNVVFSSKVAQLMRRREEFGLHGDALGIDMPQVRQRKRDMVDGLIAMHQEKFDASKTELILGEGKLVGEREVEVKTIDGKTRRLRGEHLVLSTGSRATIDPIPGLADAKPLTHIGLLEIDVVPEHLLILGGGYIGLEFAQAFRRFGSRVTIVERNARLLHREDEDVAEAVTHVFAAEGIDIVTSCRLQRVEGTSGQSVTLHVSRDGEAREIRGSHLLIAAGRTPNTDGIGVESAGVTLTQRGHIAVDELLRTSAPNTWAVGDCADSPHFTHIAFDDFRIVRDQLLGKAGRTTTGRQVPSCLFIDPELAQIGLTETAAKRQGVSYRLAKAPMKATLRTRTTSETTGFHKALIGTDDRILGYTCFGPEAGETLAVVQVAMAAGLPYPFLRDMIFTHPTMAEGLIGLFASVPEHG